MVRVLVVMVVPETRVKKVFLRVVVVRGCSQGGAVARRLNVWEERRKETENATTTYFYLNALTTDLTPPAVMVKTLRFFRLSSSIFGSTADDSEPVVSPRDHHRDHHRRYHQRRHHHHRYRCYRRQTARAARATTAANPATPPTHYHHTASTACKTTIFSL